MGPLALARGLLGGQKELPLQRPGTSRHTAGLDQGPSALSDRPTFPVSTARAGRLQVVKTPADKDNLSAWAASAVTRLAARIPPNSNPEPSLCPV